MKKLPSDIKKRYPNKTKELAIENACKRHSFHAIDLMFKFMTDETIDTRWRIQCAKEILDRGYGRPVQSVKADVNIGSVDKLIEILKTGRE